MLYRDTMGYWDELVVKDGQFSHFAPIRETDLPRAIVKARSAGPSKPTDLSAALFDGGSEAPKERSEIQKESPQQERGGRGR